MKEIIPHDDGFFPKQIKPGEWLWYSKDPTTGQPQWLVYGCLCGGEHDPNFGCFSMLPIAPFKTHERGANWNWDGNLEEPSLTPSILHHCSTGREWHGYMTKGVLTPC